MGKHGFVAQIAGKNPSSKTWGTRRICYVQTKKTGWDQM